MQSATNSSGFPGLPEGYRGSDGGFNNVNSYGCGGVLRRFNNSLLWGRFLYYINGDSKSLGKQEGFFSALPRVTFVTLIL
jgi:hypothetical protein